MKKENTFGAITTKTTEITPLSYLKEQARLLSEATGNIFKAGISTSIQNFDYKFTETRVEKPLFSIKPQPNLDNSDYRINQDPLKTNMYSTIIESNLPKREREYFHHSFRILVPKFDYSFILLTLTQETFQHYPYKVYSHLEGVLREGLSITDLEEIFSEIIKEPSVVNSLNNLINQAR